MREHRRILVVDGSRVVRATLSKHLKNDFDIVEESDGESAWQTLMLDASIVLVISGIHPPRLEAHDFYARIRSSSRSRLKNLPFVLIVSDMDSHSVQQGPFAAEVSAVLTKTMSKKAMVDCLDGLIAPVLALPEPEPVPAEVPAIEIVRSSVPMERLYPPFSAVVAPSSPEVTPLLESDQLRAALSSLPCKEPGSPPVCVLVFGIDHRQELIARFGDELAGVLALRFATLLREKVSAPDVIGRCRGERLAIISRNVDLVHGVRFGKRVCRSLASGQVTIRGQKLKLTASVGVASTSDDAVTNGLDLYQLADQRLDQSLVCGGNAVSTDFRPNCPLHNGDKRLRELLTVLSAPDKPVPPDRIGALGVAVFPVIEALNRELSLNLPLAEIRARLEAWAQAGA